MCKKQISIVVGTFNRKGFLKILVSSLRKEMSTSELNYEIIIVDGGSTDGTLEWLLKQKDIITIVQHNRAVWRGQPVKRRSWGYFMNLGFKCTQGKYVCMLSDDCIVVPGAIINGYDCAEGNIKIGKKVGGVAFYWRNWPEKKQYWVGLTLGNKMFVNHGLYLRQALVDVDYIDEESYEFYHADGDLSLKMWKLGYECIDSPNSYIEHYSHANVRVRASNLNNQQKDWNTYLAKWEGIFFEKDSDDYGGWIEKSYDDQAKVSSAFSGIGFKIKNMSFVDLIKTAVVNK